MSNIALDSLRCAHFPRKSSIVKRASPVSAIKMLS